MGENYVDLMWRVVKNQQLVAAFVDLHHAKQFAEVIGGEVWVATTHKLET